MRIIKRGQLPEEKEYRCTCRRCSTAFEFRRDEAEYIHDQRDGDVLKIGCPVCNEWCWINAKLL